MTLKHRLDFIKNTPSDELVKHHLKVVFKTYYEVFGKVCTGCPTKIAGYINRLKKFNINIMEKSNSNFTLKPGALIVFRGKSKAYSNANLTDEVAIRFLKGNENRKVLFAKLPKNLDEMLSGEASKSEKALKDYTVKELKELYPNAKGKDKTELIANIQESINKAVLNDESEEVGKPEETSNEEE